MFLHFCNPKFIFISAFFAVYFIIGSCIYDDYGVSTDEYISRNNGFINLKYISKKLGFTEASVKLKKVPELKYWKDKDYGVAFELPLTVVEILLKPDDLRESFLIRHYAVFFIFFISVICFYFLIYDLYKNWLISFAGSLFLILSPRIFAHSFYNSKDLVTLSCGIFALYALFKLLDKKTCLYSVFLGLTCAVFVSMRIIGIYLPLISVAVLILYFVRDEFYNLKRLKSLSLLGSFLLSFTASLYLIWPILWESPIENFLFIFENMKSFRWGSSVLYFGEFVKGSNLPWHYIPVWFTITTPVVYLVLFLIGLTHILLKSVSNFNKILDEKNIKHLILVYLFFSPIFAVILLKSTLYDAWRHLLFIYPFFLIIAVYGLRKLILEKSKIVKLVTVAVVSLCLVNISYIMYQMHPHQNTYFNLLAGKDINKNFEMDYWCTSCYDGLKYILQNDKSNNINVNILPYGSSTFKKALILLKIEEKKRIKFSNARNADYFMSNFRYRKTHRMYVNGQYPFVNEFYSIRANGNEILVIYRPNKIN